jgi:hypothetical protein
MNDTTVGWNELPTFGLFFREELSRVFKSVAPTEAEIKKDVKRKKDSKLK